MCGHSGDNFQETLMRRLCRTGLVMAAILSPAILAPAHPPRKKDAPRRKPDSTRKRLRGEFARGPAVGSKLPEIAAFDASGKPFRLSSLKGSHTVLVFGCLT